MGLKTFFRQIESYIAMLLIGLVFFLNRDLTIEKVAEMLATDSRELFYRLATGVGLILLSGLTMYSAYRKNDLKDIEEKRKKDRAETEAKIKKVNEIATDTNTKINELYKAQVKNSADDQGVKIKMGSLLDKVDEYITTNEKNFELMEKKIHLVEKNQENMEKNHNLLAERVSTLESKHK